MEISSSNGVFDISFFVWVFTTFSHKPMMFSVFVSTQKMTSTVSEGIGFELKAARCNLQLKDRHISTDQDSGRDRAPPGSSNAFNVM